MNNQPPPSNPSQPNSSGRRQQSIQMQNLSSPYDEHSDVYNGGDQRGATGGHGPQHLDPSSAQMNPSSARISTYWDGAAPYEHHDAGLGPDSPIDAAAFSFALPPEIQPPPEPSMPDLPTSSSIPYISETPYYDDVPQPDYFESDRAPLTSSAQPISGALPAPQVDVQGRSSFQTVSDMDHGPTQRPRDRSMLGFDLEPGFASHSKSNSRSSSLTPGDYKLSRSPSTAGAIHKAGSIVRAMSQRVVNIGGEGETLEHQQRRQKSRSRSPSADGREQLSHSALGHDSLQFGIDTSYQSQFYSTPPEKREEAHVSQEPAYPQATYGSLPNPLKGRSLGIFGPENPLRKRLCDLLVQPYTEPLILMLIVLQAVLLAVDAAPNVFENPRRPSWGSPLDYALLALFIVFTIELIARIIVSGFVMNAPEYSTIDRKKGIRAAVVDQYRTYFGPQRQKSIKRTREEVFGPQAFGRSFTMMHGQRLPERVEDAQRMQLARRAFLRHGFNRLDFVAVVSFWITFGLSITGIEMTHHIFIFRMLSCLRILRLLALTNGTATILRSLKKAAPLLVRVSFLIGFFWLLFAIIGVQSFKSSLSRQCVWLDPDHPTDLSFSYTNSFTFCGGYLDNSTGNSLPWVFSPQPGTLDDLQNGTTSSKGYICPKGSICLLQQGPYNDTVSFDDILHSLELVFVIMSANTFSDIMYYTTYSDYIVAALFFGAAILFMMLWMTNLLIAVITSSFQVIREESKASAFTGAADDFVPAPHDEWMGRTSTLQKIYDKTSLVWVLCIVFDLLAQAFRSASMTPDRANFISIVEIVVTSLLDLEIAIRIAANFRNFHRSYKNLFDLFLAIATTIVLIPPIRNSGQPYAWLTIFEMLRSYRVVLAIPITRKLILQVLGNASGIGNLIIFVFLITFIMAIFAVQLFRQEIPMYDDDGQFIEVSFYNIFNAFLGMYQILSSENWTSILYNVTAYTSARHTSWYGAMFIIGWFILSFFILINMFIAVIQENFDVSEDEKRLQQVKAFLQRKELGSNTGNLALSTIFSFGRAKKRRDPLDYGPATMEMLLKDAVVRDFLDDPVDPLQQSPGGADSPSAENRTGNVKPGRLSAIYGRIRGVFTSREPNPFYSNIRFDGASDAMDPRQMARQAVSATSERRKAQREYLARHPTYNNALYIFKPNNPIRRFCQRIVGPGRGSERFDGVEPNKIAWYTFSAVIYAAIVAMVVLACVTTPLYQKEYFANNGGFSIKNWFVWVDMAFAVVFTVEAIIKVVADGLFFTPNAYFRSSWGLIDAIVLITLWIDVGTLLANDGAVSRAVGAFKALRALRLLNVSDSARETFHSLIIIVGGKVLGAAFVSMSLLIPFAIYAINLFNGQLLMCNDGSVTSLADCSGEWQSTPYSNSWGLLAPRSVSNPYYSFDDFASSLLTLFTIVSQEGWIDVSFAVQSITARGLQPQDLSTPGNAVFFVIFNLMATVFVLTLFISVFMRNYTEQTGVAFLTGEQRSWLELRKLLRQISPSKSSYDESEKRWKKWCHKRAIEKRGKWYTLVTIILVFHLILLMLEFASEPEWWTHTRDALFLFFTLIYIANIFIRVFGLGWSRFRRSSWDIFSVIAVTGAFATSILFLSNNSLDTYVQLHKFFLVAIVLLLIPRNDALDQLFKTAAASLPMIVNLLATWFVFFVMFAIAMTQIFSLTRFGDNERANVNFRTVPNALILLFRFSCGEGWNQVMEDYANILPPLCVEDNNFFNSDCGSTAWARSLFIAWNIISMYIFVNLFISLIYESFSYVYQRSSGLAQVDRDEIRRFKEAWRSVDPSGTGFISKEAFPRLLGELSGVFEMRIYEYEDSVSSILEEVGTTVMEARHNSISTANTAMSGVSLQRLNDRLARLDVNKIRERRRRFNVFYEEVMVSADPDRGISFTSVLMILAHYNIISDSKCLKLEEFLRRRARLQRVEEEIRRRIVLGFFDTLYWSRKFRKHMEKKNAARMTGVPEIGVPDIFVEDESEPAAGYTRAREDEGAQPQGPTVARPPAVRTTSYDLLAASDAQRPHHRSWSSSVDISTYDTSYAHPLSLSRAAPSTPAQRAQTSSFSFEVHEPGTPTGEGSRRGSAVSPAQVREFLDDSVWVESIRRSATMRRPDHPPH